MKRLVVSAVVVFLGCLAVAVSLGNLSKQRIPGVPASVVRADGGCSAANLNGPYAVSRQGTLVASVLGLPAPAPWGEVALANFNGGGTFTFTVNLNIGGIAISGVGTGTYTVNSDCTGTITVHPNPPFNSIVVTQAIALIHGGQQYIATDTDSFSVVQGRGERLSTEQ